MEVAWTSNIGGRLLAFTGQNDNTVIKAALESGADSLRLSTCRGISSVLPELRDEADRMFSFAGSVPQSSGAALANEDPRRYQKRARPGVGLQGCETTG